MKHMLIVETRDPFATREVQSNADLLVGMRQAGVPCTLMLAENSVLAARSSAKASFLPMLVEAGVEVAADRFALAERGISDSEVADGIQCSDLAVVVDRLAAGATVLWR